MSGLTDTEKVIVDYLNANLKITTKKTVSLTKLSSAQVRRIFVSLQDKNIIISVGQGRGRYYVLNSHLSDE